MSGNPYDPTKPGEYTDWAREARKTGDLGAGRNTTHAIGFGSNAAKSTWGGSTPSTNVTAPMGSGYVAPAAAGGVGRIFRGVDGKGSSPRFSAISKPSFFQSVRGILTIALLYGAFDGLVEKNTPEHSRVVATQALAGIANSIGALIMKINPNSGIVQFANDCWLIIGYGTALGVGYASGLGNIVAVTTFDIGKAVVADLTSKPAASSAAPDHPSISQ